MSIKTNLFFHFELKTLKILFYFKIAMPRNHTIFNWRQGVLQKKLKQNFDKCEIDSQQSFMCVKHNNRYANKHQAAIKQCWWLGYCKTFIFLFPLMLGRLTGILNLITLVSNKIERKNEAANMFEDHRWNKQLWGWYNSINCTMYFKLIVFNRFYNVLDFSECFWVTFYIKDKYCFICMCIHLYIN